MISSKNGDRVEYTIDANEIKKMIDREGVISLTFIVNREGKTDMLSICPGNDKGVIDLKDCINLVHKLHMEAE